MADTEQRNLPMPSQRKPEKCDCPTGPISVTACQCATTPPSEVSVSIDLPNRLPVVEWMVQTYQSGTMVVVSSFGGPWLYVYGPGNGDEKKYNQDRFQCCRDLCAYLNAGSRPRWLDDLKRVSETHAIDLDGTSITATGPMVDVNPPACDWRQDESEEAKDARARLMDRLFLAKDG